MLKSQIVCCNNNQTVKSACLMHLKGGGQVVLLTEINIASSLILINKEKPLFHCKNTLMLYGDNSNHTF